MTSQRRATLRLNLGLVVVGLLALLLGISLILSPAWALVVFGLIAVALGIVNLRHEFRPQ